MRRIAYLCACGMLFFLLACGGGATATGLVSATERRQPLHSETIRQPAGLHSDMIRQPAGLTSDMERKEPAPLTPIN